MSHFVPRQQPLADAAPSERAPASSAARPLPEFPSHVPPPGLHSPIEREIERSERASAALAAARAVARASFTDSQLAADDAAIDFNDSGWVRTEYAALDHRERAAEDEAPREAPPRNLVGGSFNPGIASQHGRAFPGASIAHAPIKTRTGAQARFLQEARHAPRGAGVKVEPAAPVAAANYDKPAVMPVLAPAIVTPGAARATVAPRARPRAPAPTREPLRLALAVGAGAAIVLAAGAIAMKAGLLTRSGANDAAMITARAAAQAEANRVLSAAAPEIAIAPAAGVAPSRSDAEVDAALAAAARAAAVPVATVHAAGPARAVPVAVAVPAPQRAPAHAKDSVAAAIANAQARADSFLASGGGTAAPAPATEVKPGP